MPSSNAWRRRASSEGARINSPFFLKCVPHWRPQRPSRVPWQTSNTTLVAAGASALKTNGQSSSSSIVVCLLCVFTWEGMTWKCHYCKHRNGESCMHRLISIALITTPRCVIHRTLFSLLTMGGGGWYYVPKVCLWMLWLCKEITEHCHEQEQQKRHFIRRCTSSHTLIPSTWIIRFGLHREVGGPILQLGNATRLSQELSFWDSPWLSLTCRHPRNDDPFLRSNTFLRNGGASMPKLMTRRWNKIKIVL